MPVFSAIVLFAFIWFLTFLVVLPIRLRTQGEAGSITPGTPQSAPADPQIRRRALITTAVATLIWGVVAWVIISGAVTVDSIDVLNRWLRG